MSFAFSRRVALGACLAAIAFPVRAQERTFVHRRGETRLNGTPQRAAVYDLGLLDILRFLEAPVAGVPGTRFPEPLREYGDTRFAKIGSLFEPDLAALKALKPDLVLVAGRSARQFEILNSIAPTLDLSTDATRFIPAVMENIVLLGQLFGRQASAAKLQEQLARDLAGMQTAGSRAGNALVLFTVGENIIPHYAGSRFGVVYDVIGMKPSAAPPAKSGAAPARSADATPEQQAAQQAIREAELARALASDPDWLIVLDRGAATGGKPVADILLTTSDPVTASRAWKNRRIFYLDPAGWYLATGAPSVLLNTIRRFRAAIGA